jgi:hypothetical protein
VGVSEILSFARATMSARFLNAAAPLPAHLRDGWARSIALLGRRWVLHPDNRVRRRDAAAPRAAA